MTHRQLLIVKSQISPSPHPNDMIGSTMPKGMHLLMIGNLSGDLFALKRTRRVQIANTPAPMGLSDMKI